MRDADGSLHYPIDFPHSYATALHAINNRGVVVGFTMRPFGIDHGLLLILPDTFVQYDDPGAFLTRFYGMNDRGEICGSYPDLSGRFHGILLQEKSATN